VFKREVEEWNSLYDQQFIKNTTDIPMCSSARTDHKKLLKPNAKCNKWGPWMKTPGKAGECPTCGDGLRQEQRYCYNYTEKDKKPESLCETNDQKSTIDRSCKNECKKEYGSWTIRCSGCSKLHTRECWYMKNGKKIERTWGCSGRSSYSRSSKCGGWKCEVSSIFG